MNITKNWRIPQIPPIRQTLTNVFGTKSYGENYIISKEIDQKLGLRHNQKVTFEKVEEFVNSFVEEEVPHFVDDLYKYSDEIKALKQSSACDNELRDKCLAADKLVQEISEKVTKIDKLRTCVRDEDLDDFDLRIQPTKLKINKSVEHFLSANSGEHAALPQQPLTSSRSQKARDLLSYLSTEESENCFQQNSSADDNEPEVLQIQENLMEDNLDDNLVTEESLELLNKDLADLHSMMNDLHVMVHDQGETVDQIADNVETAEENVVEGNRKLKKATIIKAAMFPVVGAIVGGVIGGPIGCVAGMKVGSMTGGFAMAGVTGTVLGYQGGKILKKKQQDDSLKTE